MNGSEAFIPLRYLTPWPEDLFRFSTDDEELSMLDRVGLTDFDFDDSPSDESILLLGIALLDEVSIEIPGLHGYTIVFGVPAWDSVEIIDTEFSVKVVFGSSIIIGLADVDIAVRMEQELLRPVVLNDSGNWLPKANSNGTTLPFEFRLNGVNLNVDLEGDVEIGFSSGAPEIEINAFMVGESGLIIEPDEPVSFHLSSKGTPPIGKPQGWKGVYIPHAKIHFPEIDFSFLPTGLEFTNCYIGSGGFSGQVDANWELGDAEGSLRGMTFSLRQAGMIFEQSVPVESKVRGRLTFPFFDEPIDIEIGINLDGSLSVRLDSENGLVTLTKDDILEMSIDSLAFEIDNNDFIIKLSGQITPLIGKDEGLDWPTFQVNELSIDSDGNVRLDGGWLDLREQYSLDFYGFQLEITKLGFGKSDDGGKWIGFSGGLKLVDGIPAGASVEGLRLTWYDDDREPKISFNGVGVEFEVPDVLRFKGAVSYQQLEVEGELVDRFAGSIKLELISLDMLIDATLVFGTAEGDDERYNFFAIYLAVDLPAGIPLWATGLSLYGMAGLFAMQMEPDKHDDEEWYGVGPTDGWYKRPDTGVTDLTNKWINKEESLALGAGVTIGTAADNGHAFSGRMIFVLVFPGPILLIDGKANILKERSKLGEEPTFRCLSVLDRRAGTFLMGLDAQYKSGEDGELIDISGSAEAFFNLEDPNKWHLYLGEKEPREKRIRAEILSLFEANSYFMLDAQWVSTGAWVGYDAHWEFGPLSVGIEAWIETNATISTKPAHLFGELWLHGSADLDVYGFGIGLSVDAEFNADVFDPFHVLGKFEVGINLPWPLSDIDVDITLEWPSDGPDGIPPPLPLPLKEIAIEHFKVTTSWPLQRGSLLLPNYSTMDGFLQDPDNDPSLIEGEEPPLDLPIVPVDCRPHITFGRTVHDDALIGVNPQPVLPNAQPIGWEWIGDPEKNQGTVRVRYGLQEISLHKYVEGMWELVARKGETVNPTNIPELFGSWAPMPQLPAGTVTSGTDSPIANVKLWLWSKTPFDYTRHNGNAWDEWFAGQFSDYPCIPAPLGNEICCDFENVELNKRINSPWICPEHPDLQIIWFQIEKIQNIRMLDEVIDGISHAFCPSSPFIILKFASPVESVSITIVSEEGVQAAGFNLQGDELIKSFGGTPDDPHVVVEANDLSFIYLQGKVEVCLIKICAVGVDAEEVARREVMTQHLSDEMARWQQEGEVLESHTTYRLKIISSVETKDFPHDASFNKIREQNEYAYFRTEGPPGLTAISVPEGHSNPDEFDSGLNDLTRYVRQTIPATVSSEGEKPQLPRPVYRAYDVGAEFNEDYVDLMYRLEKRDLGLYLYDNNNQPVRDAQGRLIILNNNWGVTEELTLSKSERTWINAVDVSTCATLDSSLIVHDSTLNSVAEGPVLDADTIYEAKFIPVLLHEDFADFNVGAIIDGPAGTIDRWQVFDQGDISEPSHWDIGEEGTPSSNFIVQTSNIYGGTLNGNDPVKPGTFLLLTDNISLPMDHSEQPLNWSDYRFSVTLRSGDNNAIGFTFRYLDANNYYLFTMDRERKYRRLVRVIDSIHTILIKDNFVYRVDHNYLFTVEAINSSLRIYMEGALVFDVSDDSIDHGRIGLYCWGNTQARFSDLRVDDISVAAPVVYRFKFTTSQYANFFHHLHSFQDETWQSSLEDNQLSNEELSTMLSTKVLPDSDFSDTEMRAYNSLVENIFGSTSTVNPPEIQITRVIRDEKIIAMLLQSPEPIDWKRTQLEVLTTDRNTISPQLPDAVKLTDVNFGTTQPNEEFVTLLLRENINLSEYEIDHYHLPSIISEPIGDSVLFIDDFDTKEGGVLFQESFGPNALDYYEIIDEGINLGPSNWHVIDNVIVQTKNIYGGSVTGLVPDKPGTMAVVGSPSWSNVLINVTLGSDDNDAIGVVFRYKDDDNYYRFSMDRERSYRRLVKKVDGSFYVLWEDNNAYNQGQSYELVIYVYGAQILCYIDNTYIFSLYDSDISTGRIGFYCWASTGAFFNKFTVDMLESPPLQWKSTFEDISEVNIIDSGDQQGPSSWVIDDGALLQTSNIYGGSTNGAIPDKPGTFALCGDVSWKDVKISVRLSSGDNDAIGLMFRVTPLFNLSGDEVGHNFYRFSMDRERGYRRLVKKVGDLTTILWQDNFSYIVDQSYELSIDAVGSELRAYLDGSLLFTVHDDELRDGKIGLYCWANTGARFEQVVVIDRTRQIGRWEIHDEGTNSAPSVWRLNEGVLVQTANIFGGSTLEIDPVKPGTFAVAGNRNWNDYRLAVTLRSDDDDAIGVLFRYTDEDNYYRLSLDAQRNYRRLTKKEDGVVTTLWEDTSGYAVGVSFVLTIDAIGSRLVGYMDSDRLFDIMDASHTSGKVGLYCWGNIGARFEHIKVCIPPLAAFAHISDHFSNDDISDWSFLDEGTSSSPSSWATFNGVLRQTSNIFEQPIDRDTLAKKGTQAIIGDSAWTNVVLSARLQSFDDDAIGILFRYIDENNYYRYSMDSQRRYRRLVKNIDGVFTLLWEDDFSYIVEESYDITISAIGSTLRGYVNSVPIFTVEDSDVSLGKLGLYCWGNNDARFSQIRLYPSELAFNNWLLDETFALLFTDHWIFEDDGNLQGPSQWDVVDGALLQTSNIHGGSLDEEPDRLGTHAVSGDLAWADYRVTTRLSSDSGEAIGVIFRYKDINNYYRYSMDRGQGYRQLVKMIDGVVTVLWQDSVQYVQSREYNITIECVGERLAGYLDGIQIFVVDDADLTSGRVGLYCSSNVSARFAEVRVASSIYSPYYKFEKEQTLPAGTRVRIYSGNRSEGPQREPGMEQRFLSTLEESGEFNFSTEAIQLQIRARGETAGRHSRCFLHGDEYSIVDTSVIRKEDGTGVFILNSDGSQFAEKPYRFNMIYQRDNRAVEPESQVLSQARNSEPEIANIDIPTKV